MKKALLVINNDIEKKLGDKTLALKKGEYVVSEIGIFFNEATYGEASIITEGDFPIDLNGEKFIKVDEKTAIDIKEFEKNPVARATKLDIENKTLRKEKEALEKRLAELESEISNKKDTKQSVESKQSKAK